MVQLQKETLVITRDEWHALDTNGVLKQFSTSAEGLSEREILVLRHRYGPNSFTPTRQRSRLERLASQFHNVLIYVLLVATAVTAMLGEWIDAAVILCVVVINAVVGFLQEGRAENALDAIRKLLRVQATVVRNNCRATIPASELVPGDIVVIQSGAKVPADLRIFQCRNLQIQEAVLTGEALPSDKNTKPADASTPLGDRSGMAYQGTIVSRGQGLGVVVATGDRTELGRVRRLLADVKTLETPLLLKLNEFSKMLTVVILAASAIVFFYGILVHGFSATEMFMAVVGIAVAAIPEGLPAIMTITLALGVERMVRRNAIVRRLPAIETLGSVNVICSDKTGTFTRNKMTVQSVATGHKIFSVTGTGYEPIGVINGTSDEVVLESEPDLEHLALGGLLCSDASLRKEGENWSVEGNPMEGALVVLAAKAGLDQGETLKKMPRIDAIPFDTEYRFMAVLHRDHRENTIIYIKGAPEVILSRCRDEMSDGNIKALDRDYWHTQTEKFASRGERVLAVAMRSGTADKTSLNFDDVVSDMTMLGLFGIQDPPRETAIDAVATCQSAGIRIKMITGDHAATARAIGDRLGLDNTAVVLTGAEIDALNDKELQSSSQTIDIFARTSPEHKIRLVEALQRSGHVVAMTGDGVNDAPALKQADVGIAMGQTGSDASKEAAEMVLIDDNFASIAAAVEEGRTVYDNLKKAILYILPTSAGEAFTLIVAVLFGTALPITPVQILWVNMVTTVTLALAFAFEPAESDVMKKCPREPREPLMSSALVWRTAYISAIVVFGVFGFYWWLKNTGMDVSYARTGAVNTLVMFEVWYLFNVRNLSKPAWYDMFTKRAGAAWIVVGIVFIFQAIFIYLPAVGGLFDTRPISANHLLLTMLLPGIIFAIVEIEKAFTSRRA